MILDKTFLFYTKVILDINYQILVFDFTQIYQILFH